jgi:hypothetical protein
MKTATATVAATAISILLALTACEESGSSTSGGAELADQPQSMLGRSADAARRTADAARTRDATASAMSDRLAGSGTIEVARLIFEIPKRWQSVAPSNTMRAAELHGPDITVAITIASGSIDGNIARWEGQVLDANGEDSYAEIDERTINGHDATLVELTGTYMEGAMGGNPTARENWTMLGAIFPQGRSSLFLKLTGPADAVDDAYDDWMAMIESVTTP